MAWRAMPFLRNHAYGVAMRDIKALGMTLGRNHALAIALWATGVYEARMLASFVGDPERLTPAQMDRWCRDFDNWAFCDAMSFNLFDRSPHAWAKVAQWSSRRNQFRSEEHTSELQSQSNLVCRLLLEKKKKIASYELAT